jgi:hypothetical protein
MVEASSSFSSSDFKLPIIIFPHLLRTSIFSEIITSFICIFSNATYPVRGSQAVVFVSGIARYYRLFSGRNPAIHCSFTWTM